MKIFLKSLSLFFLFTFTLRGQDRNDTINYRNLGEVLVTAYRISSPLKSNPGAVSLVGTPALRTLPRSVAVDEALRMVPGVRIDNQANGSRVHMSVRGQGILTERGIRGIKVLVDGLPVNDPSGFAPDLYDIDWTVVSRVEVLRGPSASLYGGGSNAGILNITTPEGGPKGINGTFYSSAGSNGFYKLMAQADGTLEKLKYRLSYSNYGGDGYRHHTAFRGSILSEKINWTPTEKINIEQVINITQYFNQNAEGLNLSQLDDPRQANPDAIPFNEYQDTKRMTTGIVSDFKISQKQDIRVTGYIKVMGYKEPGSSAVQYRDFITPGGSLQYNLSSGTANLKNYLSAGIDFQVQNIDEYKLPNIKDPDRTEEIGEISYYINEGSTLLANQAISQSSFGAFLIDRTEIGSKLNSVLSIRYDMTANDLDDKLNKPQSLSGSADFNKVSSRFGLVYNLNPSFNIYGNIGQGFLPPSTEELINNPESYGGFNQGLVPATSLGEELGLRGYLLNSFYYDIALFHMDTRNDFYRYRISTRPLETFYGNAGSSNRYGAELYFNWVPLKNLTVQGSYTWSDFKYMSPDSIKGNYLPNCPAHQLYADIEYKFGKHLTAGISTELQSKWYIYTNEVNSDIYQEGFNLYHARLSYDFTIGKVNGTASLYGRNLTNVQYIAFTEPDPDGNSYQPSARKEFFLAIKILF